jgi:hypothetical protein
VVYIDASRQKHSFGTSHPWEWPIDVLSKLGRRKGKVKMKKDILGLETPHNKSRARASPTHRKKGKVKMGSLKKTILICKQRMTMER